MNLKKIIALALVVCMVLSFFPVSVFAEEWDEEIVLTDEEYYEEPQEEYVEEIIEEEPTDYVEYVEPVEEIVVEEPAEEPVVEEPAEEPDALVEEPVEEPAAPAEEAAAPAAPAAELETAETFLEFAPLTPPNTLPEDTVAYVEYVSIEPTTAVDAFNTVAAAVEAAGTGTGADAHKSIVYLVKDAANVTLNRASDAEGPVTITVAPTYASKLTGSVILGDGVNLRNITVEGSVTVSAPAAGAQEPGVTLNSVDIVGYTDKGLTISGNKVTASGLTMRGIGSSVVSVYLDGGEFVVAGED